MSLPPPRCYVPLKQAARRNQITPHNVLVAFAAARTVDSNRPEGSARRLAAQGGCSALLNALCGRPEVACVLVFMGLATALAVLILLEVEDEVV